MNVPRQESADKARVMVMGLTERLLGVIEESGATQEEALAALASAEKTVPLLRLESSHTIYIEARS